MRIDGLYLDIPAVLQEFFKFPEFLSHESEAVHARIQLDMHRKITHPPLFEHGA